MKLECNVSEIDHCCSQAIVRGRITGVSPIKTSRKNAANKYFNATMSDGVKTVKIMVFDPRLHKDLVNAKESNSSIEIANVQVKEAQHSS